MNEQEALEAVGDYVGHSVMLPEERTRILEAVLVYGDARELKGHVEACRKTKVWQDSRPALNVINCGDGWLCLKAPKQEV